MQWQWSRGPWADRSRRPLISPLLTWRGWDRQRRWRVGELVLCRFVDVWDCLGNLFERFRLRHGKQLHFDIFANGHAHVGQKPEGALDVVVHSFRTLCQPV